MKPITFPSNFLFKKENPNYSIDVVRRKRRTVALFISAVSAIICGLFGTVIGALSLIGLLARYSTINHLGTWLIVAAFPLSMFAAHCLDKIAETEKIERIERFKKNNRGIMKITAETMKKNLQILIIILFPAVLQVIAQQTIFNVPTADILDKSKIYVEFDAAFKLNNNKGLRRFSSFVPRIVGGAGGKTEIGLNFIGNIQPGADSTILVPTVKTKFHQNKKKDLAIFGGTNFYIPFRKRSYKFGTYSYISAAKTFGKTRLTVGGFVASKNVFAPKAVRAGGQFAFEQTINSKLTLAADWFTGKHANGYFTPGVIYKPHPQVTAYFSYSIGNADFLKGNHFFLFELGYNF